MSPFVVTCEHARNAVPPGVWVAPATVREGHVGWDPGALLAAERIAAALSAPLQAGDWSRLYVDLNRSARSEGVIPTRSFGVEVPGNAALTAPERAERLRTTWLPFRAETERLARAAIADCGACIHLSVHSFDPALDPAARTYPIGVLFDPERPFEAAVARRLLDGLRARGVDARANEPYLGVDDGHTTDLRAALGPAYAGLEIELNQGLLAMDGAFHAAVDHLLAVLPDLAR